MLLDVTSGCVLGLAVVGPLYETVEILQDNFIVLEQEHFSSCCSILGKILLLEAVKSIVLINRGSRCRKPLPSILFTTDHLVRHHGDIEAVWLLLALRHDRLLLVKTVALRKLVAVALPQTSVIVVVIELANTAAVLELRWRVGGATNLLVLFRRIGCH